MSERATSYQRAGRILGLVRLGWELLGVALFLQVGAAARSRDLIHLWVGRGRAAARRPSEMSPPLVAVVLYVAAFSVAMGIWRFPVSIAGFLLERHYGFGTQPFAGLLLDSLIAQALSLLAAPLIWAAGRVCTRFPQSWWLRIWAVMIPIYYFVIVLQPVVVAPWFNRYTPMQASPLRLQILALAAHAGLNEPDVYVENTSIRTHHVNAYVTGLGPSARVVINDTALRELPDDQIIAMVGHELGHYAEHHSLVGFLTGVAGIGVFLWINSRLLPIIINRTPKWGSKGLCDLATIPILYLCLSAFLVLQAPIENAISRNLERRADTYGLRLTHLNAATAHLMVGFAERDYVDPDPPRLLHLWFGTHPTLDERIEFALSYRPEH